MEEGRPRIRPKMTREEGEKEAYKNGWIRRLDAKKNLIKLYLEQARGYREELYKTYMNLKKKALIRMKNNCRVIIGRIVLLKEKAQ